MFISGVTIDNFRSFPGKVEAHFSPGMNLILGENNAGKSTMLEVFDFSEVQYNPHLSRKTKPFEDSIVDGIVRVGVQFVIKTDEIFKFFGKYVLFPIPERFSSGSGFSDYLRGVSELRFGIAINHSQGGKWTIFSLFVDELEVLTPAAPNTSVLTYSCEEAKGLYGGGITRRSVRDVEGGEWASQIKSITQRIYKFRAERMNITRAPHGVNAFLASNSANLAECLNLLQSRNSDLFNEYVEHVRHVFPSVHRIQVEPLSNVELEIRALLTPAENRRPDLSIPLSQAGTGIGQVLSILYVAMFHSAPITIAIDEPNSFLHPKAVRTLLQILNTLPTKHQYIITTHSPEVIRAAAPKSVTVVRNEDGISKVDALDPENFEHVKVGLASIGARLSDLYGADRILWVEGETEELTFPDIARKVGGFDVIGVTMLKVNATGDFESPKKVRPKMVFDTYCQLGTAGALLPPAIGFVFDSEGRRKEDMDSLTRESGNRVLFLPRLCFENYILHAGAIAAVLSETCCTAINPTSVADWVQEHGNEKAYLTPCAELEDGQDLFTNTDWLTRVHAPRLLKALFSDLTNELSDHPEEYRKTTHSVAISNWLVNTEPQFLQPLADVFGHFFVDH